MLPIPISKYAPGGEIYIKLAGQYGEPGAVKVYQAALTGDRMKLANALNSLEGKPPIVASTASTAAIFFDQITTDPLAAPLESANNQIGKAVFNAFKNPWVLVVVVGVVFYMLGGFTWAKRKLGNA